MQEILRELAEKAGAACSAAQWPTRSYQAAWLSRDIGSCVLRLPVTAAFHLLGAVGLPEFW